MKEFENLKELYHSKGNRPLAIQLLHSQARIFIQRVISSQRETDPKETNFSLGGFTALYLDLSPLERIRFDREVCTVANNPEEFYTALEGYIAEELTMPKEAVQALREGKKLSAIRLLKKSHYKICKTNLGLREATKRVDEYIIENKL